MPSPSRRSRRSVVAAALAALVAVVAGIAAQAFHVWPGLEHRTVDTRFAVRGVEPAPRDVVLVAIDDRSFSLLNRQWPFPRRWHARVIDTLRRDRAAAIAYDVQFSEPTDPTDDNALYAAIARARNVVLATTEVDGSGQTNVLGGDANLRAAHAVAGAANLPADAGGIVRSYPRTMLGRESFATAAARVVGDPVPAGRFTNDLAPIDFRGGPGAITTVSFADVLAGRVSPATFAGKVVVVGATAPTLQDLHQTATTGANPMAGVEVQANAIWTALHDNPLQPGEGWLTVLAIVACGLAAPLASLRLRLVTAVLVSAGIAGLYLVAAQFAFDSGLELAVSYPIFAGFAGALGTLVGAYAAAAAERNAFAGQLHDSQFELLQRLAQAIDFRDAETGEHTLRIGLLCRRLALEIGWSPEDADTLRYASMTHDVGKIGIPDGILLKPGPLDDAEWEVMETHTTVGAELLAGSQSPLVQMAERIARFHHERWDGTGYPARRAREAIPIEARICAVVDVYDALLSRRPYKDAWAPEAALAEIVRGSGTHFEPALVKAFLRIAPVIGADLAESYAREQGTGPGAARSVSAALAGAPGASATPVVTA